MIFLLLNKYIMKKVILSLFLAICSGMACSLSAQGYRIPETAVVIAKPQANVRQAPETTAAVVEKASKGVLYELIARKSNWYEAKDVKTGKTVYISTTVANLMEGRFLPRTDKGLVENSDLTSFAYQKRVTDSEKEAITSYVFYQKGEKDVVYTTLSATVNTMTGRSFTNETYYKGKQMGWYLLFDEQVDWEGNSMGKLDTPIVVFSNAPKGVIVNGEALAKVKNDF